MPGDADGSIVRLQLVVRWPWVLSASPWLLWSVVVGAGTFAAFKWHVEYFRSPGDLFYRAVVVLLPLTGVLSWAYSRLRTGRVRRLEPWLLAAPVLVPSIIYQPLGLATALLLTASAVAIGGTLLRVFGASDLGVGERAVYPLGAGLGALIFILFVLGLCGLYRWEVFAAALLMPPVVLRGSLLAWLRTVRNAARSWAADSSLSSTHVGISIFFSYAFTAVATLLILAPSVAHDALLFHLPAARHFVAAQALEPLPFQDYSLNPQGFEVILAAVYSLGGQAAAQFISPVFLGLVAGALCLVGRQVGVGRSACVLGTGVLLGTPFLLWTGGAVKNDLAVAAFQLIALSCALGEQDERSRGRLRLGVFMLSCSVAIKYTAFFGAPWIGLFLLFRLRGRSRKIRELAIWFLLFASAGPCWQARAYFLTGNPLYPAQFSRMVGHVAPELGSGPDWDGPTALEIPWFVHFNGHRAFESPTDNPVGFWLLMTAPLWLVVRRTAFSRDIATLWAICLCYYLLWASVYPFLRYASTVVALVLLFACERFDSLYTAARAPLRRVLSGMQTANFLLCLCAALIMSVNGPQLEYFAGRISEDEYLSRLVPAYPALQFLKESADPDARVLAGRVAGVAYASNPGGFHTIFYRRDRPWERDEVPAALAARRYDYLIVPNTRGGRELASDASDRYTSETVYEDVRFVVLRFAGPNQGL